MRPDPKETVAGFLNRREIIFHDAQGNAGVTGTGGTSAHPNEHMAQKASASVSKENGSYRVGSQKDGIESLFNRLDHAILATSYMAGCGWSGVPNNFKLGQSFTWRLPGALNEAQEREAQ